MNFLAKRLDRQSREYVPKKACAYKIQPGDEETAKTLSGRLRKHDEAVAPRAHATKLINKKITDGNGISFLPQAFMPGRAQLMPRK